MTPPTLRFKAGVRLDGLQPAGKAIVSALTAAVPVLTRDLTITCTTGDHAPTDPHTRGVACDVRAADLSEGQVLALRAQLQKTLGPDFTVLYETPTAPQGVLASIAYVNPAATGPHLHIQLRKGLTTWTAPTDAAPSEGANT